MKQFIFSDSINTFYINIVSACVLTAMLTACQPSSDSAAVTPPGTTPTENTPDSTNKNDLELEAQGNNQQVLPEVTIGEGLKEVIENASTDEFADDNLNDMQKSYAKMLNNMQEEMALMLGINNVDVAFARGMLGHHRGAIDMTTFEKRYGEDVSLQALAQTIHTTEKNEIAALRKWLASHPDTRDVEPETVQARTSYQYAIDAMFNKLNLAIATQNPDVAFAQAMLAHHRGAEAMANIQLKYGQNDEMKALAEQIINEQLSEIAALEAWLVEQGFDPSPRLVPISSLAPANDKEDSFIENAPSDIEATSEKTQLENEAVTDTEPAKVTS